GGAWESLEVVVSGDAAGEEPELVTIRRWCAVCREPGRGVAHRHRRAGETFLECRVAYCDLHGGEERARIEGGEALGACDFARAPGHLSREQVLEGARQTMSLEHVYVV